MNRRIGLGLIAFTLIESSYCLTVRADFESGIAAYELGDFKAAAREFDILVNEGEVRAGYPLGKMHVEGQGVDQNYEKAFELMRWGALQGEPPPRTVLAICMNTGWV